MPGSRLGRIHICACRTRFNGQSWSREENTILCLNGVVFSRARIVGCCCSPVGPCTPRRLSRSLRVRGKSRRLSSSRGVGVGPASSVPDPGCSNRIRPWEGVAIHCCMLSHHLFYGNALFPFVFTVRDEMPVEDSPNMECAVHCWSGSRAKSREKAWRKVARFWT